MEGNEKNLKKIRVSIDKLDEEIQSQLVERAKLVKKVAIIKSAISEKPTFYRPEREAQVLDFVMSRNCAPLSKEQMALLFREIMSACLAIEQKMLIAYPGPAGTFSEMAVIKCCGHSVDMVSVGSIDEVFKTVEDNNTDMGVVLIYNSTGGPVVKTMEALNRSSLKICGEVFLLIHQCFLRSSEAHDQIKKIYSHEQSLLECKQWLKKRYPDVVQIPVSSNVYAAELASKDPFSAAVAGHGAAGIHNLEIVAKNIQDEKDNRSRFIVIGKLDISETGNDKTSILVNIEGKEIKPTEIADKIIIAGGKILSLYQIDNLIFIDLDKHHENTTFHQIAEILEKDEIPYRILGSYPKASF